MIEQKATKFTSTIIRKTTAEGKLINEYLKIRSIGEGNYSKIKLMKNIEDGELYAMKKYNLFILKKKTKTIKNSEGKISYTSVADEVAKEIQVMALLDHPNVARLIELIQDSEEEKVYLIMDYCQHGEIATWDKQKETFVLPRPYNYQFIKEKFIEICKAIAYLHSIHIVHRDLKPQNILLDKNDKIKIIDFGLSVKLLKESEKLKGSVGTYHFMAPEMLSEVYPEGYDGKRCDIWSLGISFFAILFGSLPFFEEPLLKLFQVIEKGSYVIPNHDSQFTPFVQIITLMLSVDPPKRPTAQQLIDMLQKLE